MTEPKLPIPITTEEKEELEKFFWDNYDPLTAPPEMLEELEELIDESFENETFEVESTKLIKLWHKYNPKTEECSE